MVQQWAGSHDLPRSDRTLGPQVPAFATVTRPVNLSEQSSDCSLVYPPPLEPSQLIAFKLLAFSLLALAIAHLLLFINYLHLKALVVARCLS